jgi:hypothetical protein
MNTINRLVVIAMPSQPFSGLAAPSRFDQCRVEAGGSEARANHLLLPQYDTEDGARGYLREYCREIFEEQFDGWYRGPSACPVDRTLDRFTQWFECGFHSVLVDLCDDPFKHELSHRRRTPQV